MQNISPSRGEKTEGNCLANTMEVIKIVFEEEDVVVNKRPTVHDGRKMTRQLSEKDLTREAIWERRQKQARRRNRSTLSSVDYSTDESKCGLSPDSTVDVDVPCGGSELGRVRSITEEDMDELRGSIDLGFGFDEEDGGHKLCETLPALDLYFAINRSSKMLNYSSSAGSTPRTAGTTPTSSSSFSVGTPSPRSSSCYDSWNLLQPGDTPEHIKTKLRHWATVVACNAKQRRAESKINGQDRNQRSS